MPLRRDTVQSCMSCCYIDVRDMVNCDASPKRDSSPLGNAVSLGYRRSLEPADVNT
jgi:hypothetical protein